MKAKWYMFGCLTSVILVVLLILLTINSLVKMADMPSTKAPRILNNSVLHLDLKGQIEEYSEISDINFNFLPSSAYDIIKKINSAADDSRINAILLEPQAVVAGYATLNEIIVALENFKAKGKRIYGYISNASQQDIFLLGVADEVFMNPSASAGFLMIGTGGTISFYKDLLDNLGINVRVVRAGDYKSAGEPFTRTTISPEFRRNIDRLYSERYIQLVNNLSNNYGTSFSDMQYVFERRNELFINQNNAINYGIVDELMTFERVLRRLNISEDQLVSHSKYPITETRQQMNRIAVVYALGNITSVNPQFGSANITSKRYVKILDQLEKDDNIKAIVIRVNSPGGSALESENILAKIEQVKLIKPVIISMGNIAASGGYYIAANSNYIFADPYTVTGSIGVFSMVPDLSDMADNIGINSVTIGHGKFLRVNDLFSAWNRDLERGLEIMTASTYDEFKSRVSEGRDMPLNEVENVAQGQVWSAMSALQYGLIDEIGTLSDAINKAAEIASIERYSTATYPKRKTMIEALFEEHFNLSLAKMVIKNELPDFISNPINKSIQFLQEIKEHPVQMRTEIIFEN